MASTISKSELKELILFYYSLLLVVLLMASVNMSNPMILLMLLGGSALLIFNPVYLLPVYLISSLSSDYFVVGEGLGISRLIGFILIAGCVLFQIKHKIPFKKIHVLFIALLLIYTFFSSILSLTGTFTAFIQFSQNILVILLLSQIRNVNLKTLSKLLAVSSVITLLIFAYTLKGNLIMIQAQRLSAGENVNENRFAMIIAQLAAIIFASLLIFNKKRIVQILLFPIILLAYFMLILSGSRSATIGISCAIFVLVLYLFKNQAKKIIFPVILIVIAGYFLINELQQLSIPFLKRFTIEDVRESGGSHRLEVWKILVPATLGNSPFLGFGLGGLNSYELARRYGLSHAAHNFLIDMFIQTGGIGLLLFFSYFFYIARKLKKSLPNPYLYLPIMILLTALFNGIGETIYLEKLFWNGIALAFLYVNNSSNDVQPLSPENIS